MPVELRLLGEVEIMIDDRRVAVGHARQRCVLAVLALDVGRAVPVNQLVDRVWGDRTPGDARNALYSYVARLRRAFACSDEITIERRSGGYALATDPLAVDLVLFRQLLDQARTIDDSHERDVLLDRALALWRGEPFSGIDNQWLGSVRATIRYERLTAELDHTDLRLRRGAHVDLLPELTARAAEHPLDERVAGQLMLALYRAHRPAEALCHYRDVRQRLVNELGVEPGADLSQLHQRMLTADPTLGQAAPATSATPRQLPAAPGLFSGRLRELDALSSATSARNVLVTVVVSGAGGVGKTWLVLRWAHENLEQFPDGQLYVDLHGFDPSGQLVTPEAALAGFLDALGLDARSRPAGLAESAALFRSVVAGSRLLIVVDNARSAEQVVPLLPGTPTCTVLVTSRNRLTGLATTHAAQTLDIDVLSENEARQLLTQGIGNARLAAEPEATNELLASCAGLPLALGITVARAAQHTDFSLAVLAKDMRDAAARLDALDAGDLHASLRAVLSWSYSVLNDRAATMFALLGSVPGPDISLAATASLAGLPLGEVRALLRELEHASLVQQHLPGRYRMHDLTRLYAGEVAAQRLPGSGRAAGLHRLIEFYLHSAYAGERLLNAYREPVSIAAPADGCLPDQPADVAEALTWFDLERPCLLAAQQIAATYRWHTLVWQLTWALGTFQERRGHLLDAVRCWRAAVTAAEQLDDVALRMRAEQRLGRALSLAGRHDQAFDHLRQALRLAEDADDLKVRVDGTMDLAMNWEYLGEYERALQHSQLGWELAVVSGDAILQARVLNSLAWLLARLGDYDRAADACDRLLPLARQIGYRNLAGAVLDTLGYVAHQTRRYADALDYYGQALREFQAIGSAHTTADIHATLGDIHTACAEPAKARAQWCHARDLYRAQHRFADLDRVQRKLDA